MTSLIKTIKIKKEQKIAQLIVSNIMYPEIKKVESLKETERNNKGFGENLVTKFLNVLICIIIKYIDP